MVDSVIPEVVGQIEKSTTEHLDRNTCCFLTINPNKAFFIENGPEAITFKKKFDAAIRQVSGNIKKYIIYKSGSVGDLKKIKIQYGIETGKVQHRVHCHLLLRIKHNADIQINFESLHHDICELMGCNCMMQHKWVRDSNVEEYIAKYF